MRREAGAEVESVEMRGRSRDARRLEGGVVRGSTLCLLRARESSGSASRVWAGGGEDWRMPEDGWRKDKGVEEGRAAEAGYSAERASASPSSSSDRVRVWGTVLRDVRGAVRRVGEEEDGEKAKAEWREDWSDSSAGVWCGVVTRAGLGLVRGSMVTMGGRGRGESEQGSIAGTGLGQTMVVVSVKMRVGACHARRPSAQPRRSSNGLSHASLSARAHHHPLPRLPASLSKPPKYIAQLVESSRPSLRRAPNTAAGAAILDNPSPRSDPA